MELSRRNFLAGAASAGVLGVMGLAGCAPQPAKEPDKGSAAAGEAASARPAYYMCDENWLAPRPRLPMATLRRRSLSTSWWWAAVMLARKRRWLLRKRARAWP